MKASPEAQNGTGQRDKSRTTVAQQLTQDNRGQTVGQGVEWREGVMGSWTSAVFSLR